MAPLRLQNDRILTFPRQRENKRWQGMQWLPTVKGVQAVTLTAARLKAEV
jgi:hypothetical protein